MEVRRHSCLEVLRLPYIDDGLVIVVKLITSRLVWQSADNALQILKPLLVFFLRPLVPSLLFLYIKGMRVVLFHVKRVTCLLCHTLHGVVFSSLEH